ncbi:5-oxoprolinase subunit B family protein [Solirhodobacter olei]|uniref:5-oxoprolinase subunit B family protein n=1 Tax=Solirhodobacter olei TaxID=2493082 RepID=UPI000FDC56C5|nr:allophanate hydrolase subunit 1 [Solirhodobacter olei]
MADPAFRPVAEHALLVEFGSEISDAAHEAVLRLDGALAAAPFPGFREAIPAYVNLLVDFDPLETDHAAAEAALRALLGAKAGPRPDPAVREVLACYEGDLAPDLPALAELCGMSVEAVIAAHLAGDYRVFMYGFAPGYAYLAGVPEAIRQPRKPAPVRGIPAGSLIVAGAQCLVTTLTMPTGWWVIGRSPTPILTGDPDRPFLFDVGDKVIFRRVGRDDFARAEGKA